MARPYDKSRATVGPFLLELAASGATQEQILAQYPQLTQDGLAAAFRYAADVLKGEHVWNLKTTA
ncbi:MAG: DUF433 domain-containing protein [Vicinamibacterales bacterium]